MSWLSACEISQVRELGAARGGFAIASSDSPIRTRSVRTAAYTHTDQRSLPVKSARVLPHPVSHQVHRYISTFVMFYQSFTMSYFTICRQRYANRREGNLRKNHDLFPGEHRERTATEKQTCLLTVSAAARSARTRHDVFAADRCRLVEANVSDGACAAKHSD